VFGRLEGRIELSHWASLFGGVSGGGVVQRGWLVRDG
jgi:hypothetical protein